MKITYFNGCKSIEEIKRLYHKLAMQNHPDLGGKLETMQAINNEYDIVAEQFKNIHENASGETYESEEQQNNEIPSDFRDMINNLIHMEGIIVELVGKWIWVTGNSYQHKDNIKKMGFKYASTKKAWFWHNPEDSTVNRKKMSLEDIKTKYGCTSFQTNSRMAIA